jgi:hypothetical protein
MRLVFDTAVTAAIIASSLRRGVYLVAAILRSRPLPTPGELPSVAGQVEIEHGDLARARIRSADFIG